MHRTSVASGIPAPLMEKTVGWGAHVHAKRVPTPQACGCGLPVAFDLEKQEFFCIGCGSSNKCDCRGPRLGYRGRSVNVV